MSLRRVEWSALCFLLKSLGQRLWERGLYNQPHFYSKYIVSKYFTAFHIGCNIYYSVTPSFLHAVSAWLSHAGLFTYLYLV